MIRFSIKDLPPIIDTEINLRKKITNLYPAYKTIASYITQNSVTIKNAYKTALRIQQDFHKNVQDGRYPVEILEGTSIYADFSADLCIALIGHPYNLYDSHVSMNILSKLQNDGIKVITPELLSDDLIDRVVEQLPKQMFWSAGKKLIGCALHLIDRTDIDGVIYLMSFGCGIDAFVSDLCERKIRRNKSSPFFLLTLDEHSGEAGFNTRLEAFIDMIRWRKRNESNISTHG